MNESRGTVVFITGASDVLVQAIVSAAMMAHDSDYAAVSIDVREYLDGKTPLIAAHHIAFERMELAVDDDRTPVILLRNIDTAHRGMFIALAKDRMYDVYDASILRIHP